MREATASDARHSKVLIIGSGPAGCTAGVYAAPVALVGISLIARPDVAVYHFDACYHDVADEQGTVFASLYVDQDARPGKRGGAWMAQARPRLNDGNVQHVPVAYVVCNFVPTMPGSPLLIGYKEIMTLLHETGHCLHHLFPQVDRPNIAGTNGFEWDAIELPSQLMEDFAWHRFPHAFTHIFAGGYASGYYSYLWAEVLAADGFRRFAEAGLIDRSVAARFCMEVLSRGASRPAADSFRAFRGRDADPRAMLVRHGLTTDAH